MLRKIGKKSRDLILSRLPVLRIGRPLILCFHTVGCLEDRRGYVSDYRSHSLVEFELQLDWLSSFCEFVSLDEIVGQTESRVSSARQQIALTFDDGYQDNAHIVLQLLERYNAPVAFFIATGYMSDKRLPWWDFMDWTIEQGYHCDLVAGDVVRKDLSAAEAETQRQFFRAVCRDGVQESRDRLVQLLMEKCGCVEVNDFMTFEELNESVSNPLVTIGAHTHNHFNSALLAPDEFASQLSNNLKTLRERTQSKIDYFAYPYGGEAQIVGDHSSILQKAGISAAFTTIPECVDERYDKYCQPRLIVSPRSNLTEFKAQIKRALVRSKVPSPVMP